MHHTKTRHVREVGSTQVSRVMRLAEKDFLRRASGRSPLLDASLQRAELTILKRTTMFSLKPLKKRLCLKTRIELQLLFNLRPDQFERILPSPPIVIPFCFAG